MKNKCEICQGRRRIRLPLYKRLSFRLPDAAPPPTIEDTYREYPCPECSETVSQDRVSIVTMVTPFDDRNMNPGFLEHIKRSSAHALVDELIKGGFIVLKDGPSDPREFRTSLIATLGVVSPKTVATLEQRVAKRQSEVAQKVVVEAARRIRQWGSAYSGEDGSIRKSQAIDALRDAMKAVEATAPSSERM